MRGRGGAQSGHGGSASVAARVVVGWITSIPRKVALGFFDKIFFGPFCSLFCTGMSIFGIITLITLGSLIKSEYAYTGVYFEDAEAMSATVSGCFTAAVVYVAFLGWSGISILYNKRRRKL